MNKILILITLFFATQLSAKETYRLPKAISPKAKPTYIKVKITYVSPDKLKMKYTYLLKTNKSALSALPQRSNPNVKNRFISSNPSLNDRFQNLDKLDLKAIVEKNKQYTFSKVDFYIKPN